jgi:repressor LexA
LTAKNLKIDITPRQLQVLKTLDRLEREQCYLPTIAELASELGVSRTTVFEHIKTLQKKELLTKSPGKARSLKLTEKASQLLERDEVVDLPLDVTQSGVPLVGKVAAGSPIEAIENIEPLSLKNMFGESDQIFALQVAGNSMIDDGINNGDYVICQRAKSAEKGQMVVAIIDDEEATLKRFFPEDGRVRLEPANADYAPIYAENCRVEAIVLGLLHRF